VGSSYKVTASDGALTKVTSGLIAINAAPASKLVLQQKPTSGTAGAALSQTKVAVEDKFGNLVLSSSTVTLTLSSGAFSTGKNTATANTSNGVATFSSLIINTAGSYTLTASDGNLTNVAFGVTINAAAANKLVYQQVPPATGTAGVALSPAVVAAVEDKFGNVVTTDNSSSLTLTLSSGTFANNSKSITLKVSGGLATFSGAGRNLIINKAGTYKLTASDGSLTAAVSGTVTINPGPTSKIAFLPSSPSAGTAGVKLAPAVSVALEDAFGNIVPGDSSTVSLGVVSGPPGGVFAAGSTTVAGAMNGIATFNNLTLDTSGNYTFMATAIEPPGAAVGPFTATSGTITIKAAAATKLLFHNQPPAGTVGNALSPAFTVLVEDQFGNLVTSATTVALTIASQPVGGGFSNGSTISVSSVNGVATFSNVKFTKAGSYTLLAGSGVLTKDTSKSFLIS
jgi:hypothetical protein